MTALRIAPAAESDVPLILSFIRKLAEYEKLSHLVVATEENIREHVFGSNPVAEVLLAYWDGEPVGFALYFRNFSTFLGQAGIYLEDLFVEPAHRGKGIGKALLKRLAEDRAWSADTAAWNGRCSIGTRRPSSSIAAWARFRWTNGYATGSPAQRYAARSGGDRSRT